jgi:hypothetical protein
MAINKKRVGKPKITFDRDKIQKLYEESGYKYYTLSKKLKVNKDTLLTYLKAEGLYKPSPNKKTSNTMSGITEKDSTTRSRGHVGLKELADAEDYARKWKRLAEEEETERRKLEKQNAELQRKIDTWEEKKEIEIEKIRAELNTQATAGLAGFTNPDVVGRWAELVGNLAPIVAGLRGANSVSGVIDGPNADTITMVADIFKKVDADTANKLSTVVQVYASPVNKSILDQVFAQIMASAK